MRAVLCCCAMVAAGCSPTAVVVDVALGAGEATPATLTASVFDPHHQLVANRALATDLPGRLTLSNLPGVAVPLRIALDGAGGLEAGVSVSVAPGATAHANALLARATPDRDGDGVPDTIDNCPTVANPTQANSAGGLEGDACRSGPMGDLGGRDLTPPPGSDLAGLDLGGTTNCPAGALLCEGFETALGPVWHAGTDSPVTFGTDGTNAFKGTTAAHFHSPATSSTYLSAELGESKSQPLDDTWVRVYVYVPSATEPYGATLVQMYQNNGGFNYVRLDLDGGGHLELVDTQKPSFSKSAMTAFPTDRWVCLEWHFHELPAAMDMAGQSGESEVWLDGSDVPELHVTSGLGAWPEFGVLMLSMQLNAALNAPADVWFDEFAVGPTRMGCE